MCSRELNFGPTTSIEYQSKARQNSFAVGRNSEAYCAVLAAVGGLRFANPPYGLSA